MKERDYYKTPKSNAIMRFLWKAAGGDRYLLERATYSDQIKYMCLGGIVFATGAMAGLAGGYAFYTIFSPRGSAIEDTATWQTAIMSIIFGFAWGLMIFNIDRFIVTSTGKGDGTEAITWDEFKGAIPRIIMGAIIALTISKPVEIRMFKTEIDVKLYDEQQKLEKDFERNTNANFEDRIKLVDNDLAKVENERNQLLILLTETTKKYNEAASKRVTRWTKSYTDDNGVFHPSYSYEVIDPSASLFQAQMDRLTKQIEDFDQKNASKLKKIEEYRERIRNEKGTTLSQNKKISAGLDGLLERIKLAHEIAGFWISLFITLLFMAIELTPVFFKLMLVKTPYDYLAENRDDLIKAEYGIEVKYDFYLDKEGQERHLVINHEAERLIYEKIKVTEIQKELTDYAIEQYKKKEMKRIEDNLDDYIKSIDSDEQGS